MKINSFLLATGLMTLLAGKLLLAQSDYATPYAITTLAGTTGQTGSANGTGSAALFYHPNGVAVDGSGNLYVADNSTIRKITPGGAVSTLAGSPGNAGSADGSGSNASFYGPTGVAVDGSGNIYVGQVGQLIRKITPGGVVSTLAGQAGQGSTDGPGSVARFINPIGVAVDGSGNVYVADAGNNTIRKITQNGGVEVTTLAGLAGSSGSADGSGSAARFNQPVAVALDGGGNLYVADQLNSTIRKITPGGMVSTLAGSPGSRGSADGTASAAQFNVPNGLTVDRNGNVYVADYGNFCIRHITPTGIVTTLAGVDNAGSTDGTGRAAQFNNIGGVAVDRNGILYISDLGNDTIRKGVLAPDVFGGVIAGVNLNYSSWFSYYTTASYPLVYQYYLGYEYAYPVASGAVTLYDYQSGHFWYTNSSDFPYIYDYSLGAYLYYYEANTPKRHFYNATTGLIITE